MRAYLISLFVLLSTLVGCSTSQKTTIGSIQIVAESGANQNTATAIDIVFVYDITSIGLLPTTSREWFNKKTGLINGQATAIEIISLQVPPASIVNVPLPKRYNDAIDVYSYSNFIDTAGQPAGNLTSHKNIIIRLTNNRVLYSGN
ncbi:hypothetical protein [Herminiimonas aquatilis]|uniref:Type VI secretion system protein n=1 Tax=Herminiimonas aquatilis TaxID=345342 RepID=A0ABW2JA53_9BURK